MSIKVKFFIPDPLNPSPAEAVPTAKISGQVTTKTVRLPQFSGSTFYYCGKVRLGIADGFGEIFRKGKIFYRGNFKKGRPNGKGHLYFSDGSIEYNGSFKEGKFDGKGSLYTFHRRQRVLSEEGIYRNGNLVKGTKCLYGKKHLVGRFQNMRNGHLISGEVYDENERLAYVGPMKNQRFHGKGTEYIHGKKYYEGMYKNGHKEGKGRLIKDDIEIRGMFKQDQPNGKVQIFSNLGSILFSGTYKKNERIKGTAYDYVTKTAYTGTFKNDRKDGKGKEINIETGELVRKGLWKNGQFDSGQTSESQTRKKIIVQSKIKKFIQSANKNDLKGIPSKDIAAYLRKYAGKQVRGSKYTMIKELNNFRRELNQQRNAIVQGPVVFDAYQGTEVSLETFLEDDDRVIFTASDGTNFGAYLEQCQILYECKSDRGLRNYIGRSDVRPILQFPTASGPKFYFDKSIDDDLAEGYNVFHFKTETPDIKVLSKDVARGQNMISALHCDPKDVIKISRVTKKEKVGDGLKKTITFEF